MKTNVSALIIVLGILSLMATGCGYKIVKEDGGNQIQAAETAAETQTQKQEPKTATAETKDLDGIADVGSGVTLEALGSGGAESTSVSVVSPTKDTIQFTLTNPFLSPIGVDTEGEDLVRAKTIEVYSGFAELSGNPALVADVAVKEGKATFSYPNVAYLKGTPAVEHLWLRSGSGEMAGVTDPADPWVVYKTKPNGELDMETLAIGFVMWPNGSVEPLKSLGMGKLVQGWHPELSKQ